MSCLLYLVCPPSPGRLILQNSASARNQWRQWGLLDPCSCFLSLSEWLKKRAVVYTYLPDWESAQPFLRTGFWFVLAMLLVSGMLCTHWPHNSISRFHNPLPKQQRLGVSYHGFGNGLLCAERIQGVHSESWYSLLSHGVYIFWYEDIYDLGIGVRLVVGSVTIT